VHPSKSLTGSQLLSLPLAAHPQTLHPLSPRIASHLLFQIDLALLPAAILVLLLSSQFYVAANKRKKKTYAWLCTTLHGHVAAALCMNSICKGCCEQSGVVCFFTIVGSTWFRHQPKLCPFPSSPLPNIPVLPSTFCQISEHQHMLQRKEFNFCFLCQARFWHMMGPLWWGKVKYTPTSHRPALRNFGFQSSIQFSGMD